MRRIASFTEWSPLASFAGYLSQQKIDVEATLQAEGGYDLWIINEDDFDRAYDAYSDFKANPVAPKFVSNTIPFPESKLKKDDEAKVFTRPRKVKARYINVREEIFTEDGLNQYVTLALITLSVVATFLLDIDSYLWLKAKLFYSLYMGNSFPEIRQGEVWRLVTPIFLHGGFLHLFFNMLWVYQLGGQIEKLEGHWYMLMQVIIMAITVNTAQYLMSGPNFVGMSGVVYAQLGYTWMMSQYARKVSYFLAPGTVMMMLIWMAICLVGIFPGVANTQHVAGFAMGVVWGFGRSGELSLRIKQYFRRRRGR